MATVSLIFFSGRENSQSSSFLTKLQLFYHIGFANNVQHARIGKSMKNIF